MQTVYEVLFSVQDKDAQTVLEFLHNTQIRKKLTNVGTESDAWGFKESGTVSCHCIWRR